MHGRSKLLTVCTGHGGVSMFQKKKPIITNFVEIENLEQYPIILWENIRRCTNLEDIVGERKG